MMRRRTLPARGFALAAVLWLLAGLTILAAMISQSSQTSAERQKSLRQRADAEQDFLSSRSEALYWLSSSIATTEGFGWGDQLLKVDGRAYGAGEKSTIHIQDVRGLVDLSHPNRERLTRLLLHCGAQQDQTDSLLDALEDYTDKDDLKRLNGAEASEYSAAGMAPPRNGALMTEPEIWKIFGWARLQAAWDEKHCFENITVSGDGRFNIGTATADTLEAAGLNAEQTEQLLKERAAGDNSMVNLIEARQQAASFMGMIDGRWPARRFRVTHALKDLPWVLRYDLKLTTNAEGSPWEISSPRRFSATSAIIAPGRAAWPQMEKISDTDKNVITRPALPF